MANDDMELVRQYVTSQSESAFAALVSRYTDLVYSAALRRVGNSQLAEEITQAVFTILAQKAGTFNKKTVLPGWLYRAACYVSNHAIKKELRRQRREQEAYMESGLNQAEPEVWPQIMPLLEDAMMRLGKAERDALVLRFFEGHSLKEAGIALGTSEAAAKMRVNRALEKLRAYFLRHGVNSTAETIAGAMSANFVMVAPPALAKMSAAVALTKGAATSAGTLTLAKGALNTMAWTKAKTAVAVAVTAIVFGTGTTLLTTEIIHAIRVAHYPNIAGVWEGVVHLEEPGVRDGQEAQAHFILRLFKTNGVYRATTDWPEWGKKDVPTVDVIYDHPNLIIHPTVRETWNLTVNPQASQLYWDRYINFVEPDPETLRHTTTPTPVPEPLAERDFAPQPSAALQGYWEGKIGTGTNAVPMDLKIGRQGDGTFRAEADIPMHGIQGRPLIVSYHPPAIEFRPADGAGMFRGQMNDANTQISGSWMQGGLSVPAMVQRVDYQAEHAHDADKDYTFVSKNDLQGHWIGAWTAAFDSGAIKVPIREGLDIAKLPDGSYSATLANVDGFGKEAPVPASDFEYSPPNLTVECESEDWAFNGKLENGKLKGMWFQGGGHAPLVFERTND